MRIVVAATALGFLSLAGSAQASSYSNIYTFCSKNGCSDGAAPFADLVADGAGNYFGTTSSGGNDNRGVVFELSPNGGSWTYKVVYAFCPKSGCADGFLPDSAVILDTSGNLYGTTRMGGVGNGTIFRLSPKGHNWSLKVLHDFCVQPGCTDGSDVMSSGLAYLGQHSAALYDGTSPLFGTTYSGGAFVNGTVFSLTPPAPGKKKWRFAVIHDFCAEGGNCNTTGSFPTAGVVVDSLQNLYGTTLRGGEGSSGTVFQLARGGKKWKETVLHSFCTQSGCPDGALPGSLAESGAGDLYGAASGGAGQSACGGGGCGTIFKLTPAGKQSKFTLLHAFCTFASCGDGFEPSGRVALLANGDIVGVTSLGGDYSHSQSGGGVLYRVNGSGLTVLHAFCAMTNCADGNWPIGGPAVDSQGDIFGTTSQGANAEGTVFEYKP